MDRTLQYLQLPPSSILCGDFNAHHSWSNPGVEQQIRGDILVDWFRANRCDLVNGADTPTYNYTHGNRTSILDLTLATPDIFERLIDWAVDQDAHTGSDHEVVRFSLVLNTDTLVPSPMSNKFNWQVADWESFQKTLQELMAKSSPIFIPLVDDGTAESLDQAASILTDSIHQSLSLHVPLSKPCSRSKRWWTEELTGMRTEMAKCYRKWKHSRLETDYTDYKRSRNKYFRKIRDSKANCWQSFLNTA
ncbi:unnamed protein product [Tuber aestivum]|uniref:Endonuclease/exonuclease/phosphatase domain-containing protein n=1 Tax=Tuber aestivum TaxID=59557 RepID=A0A292PPZ5_9PEZI|nr:unnamed protein product [Tuber aestivum]